MATDLNAQKRTALGTGPVRRLLLNKTLPAVLYGKGIENQNIQVDSLEMERLLRTKLGDNTFINLKVEGDKDYGVLIKDYDGDVITRKLTHIDFWSVKPDREVEVTIETRTTGKAPGLLLGGILEHIHHTVKLLCRADSIPEDLVVDLSDLDVGQNIHLLDLKLPEGVKARENYNPTIVSMVEEKKREAAAAAAEAAALEAAAPAEGEAPAEGAAAEGAAEGGDAKPAEGGRC